MITNVSVSGAMAETYKQHDNILASNDTAKIAWRDGEKSQT